jgi:molybdopterin/thiamine biosynthesis adenylyltransferase
VIALRKPCVKAVYPPFPLSGGRIQIGGIDYGMAAELTDDDRGNTWKLLTLLDGTRTHLEVVAEMRVWNPLLTDHDVDSAISELATAGYLEDAVPPPSAACFSVPELERYRRNLEFFSYFNTTDGATKFDKQARLRSSKVTVLGLGGLGSFVALSLVSAGVGDVLLVDDDSVELSNLNRQVLYTASDIGRPKCEAAAERLATVNPHVKLEARNLRVKDVETARSCFTGRDLLICAADRPRVRIYDWLNEAAVAQQVAWIRGANDGLTVLLFLHVPGETACFECEQRASYSRYDWYGDMLSYATDVIGDRTINPCTAPVAGIIGNIAALEAVKYLTGAATPVIRGRKMGFDLRGMETWYSDGEKQADCPVCSHLDRQVKPLPGWSDTK